MSMQSRLRDMSRVIGTTLVTLVLLGSVVSLGFAFATGDEIVVILGVSAARTTWLGYLAMVTFGLTLVELILDPRGIARKREQAVRALASLKAEYRANPAGGPSNEEASRITQRYEAVMETVPEVPEFMFNRLKSAHLRKVEISRIISANPGMGYRQARRALRARLS